MPRILSHQNLITIAYIFSASSFAFGLNALFNREYALTFFGFDYPHIDDPHRALVDTLMLVYGVRDIYMGLALLAAASYKHLKVIGWLTLATGGIAVADGAICWNIAGEGYWGHWAFTPVIFAVAADDLGWLGG